MPPVVGFPFYAVNSGGLSYCESFDFGVTWDDNIATPITSRVVTFAALSSTSVFMFAQSGQVSAYNDGSGFVASSLPSTEWNFAVKSETYTVAVRQTGAAANAHTTLDGGATWNDTGVAVQFTGFGYSSFTDQFLMTVGLNISKSANGYNGLTLVHTGPRAVVRLGAFGACVVAAYQTLDVTPTYVFGVSGDGGNTFTNIDSTIAPNPFGVGDQSVTAIAGDSAGTVVCSFSSFEYAGVLTSNDNGATWALVQPFLNASFARVMFDSGVFYLLLNHSTAPIDTALYSSSDGITWTLVHTWAGVTIAASGIFSGTFKVGLARHAP